MNTTRAWGSVRCSSSCSAPGGQGVPKPLLPVLVVSGTSPPLFFHHKSKTPRLVKKIKVRLKPSQHMGVLKLGVTLCQTCSTFVMSFTPQHDKMSLLEVLPNSLGTEVPAFWLSCYHRPCEMYHSTVSSADGPEHKCTPWQGPMCLSISVLSSGLRYSASPCTHQVGWVSFMTQRGQLARNKLVSVVLTSNRAKLK